jgi:hypothetical protein
MLFLDGVHIDSRHGSNPRFLRVKAPTGEELTQLTHTIADRVGRYITRSAVSTKRLSLTRNGQAGQT